jgi:mannose-1-phosphate guanylyltransferase
MTPPLQGLRALLLAGGCGTRLQPLTATVPKCLVPIAGRPLLGWWFDLLFEAGLERAVVNTHHLPEAVRAYCAASPWADRVDLVHEPALLGTAATLRANASRFGGTLVLAHADNLSCFSPAALMARHAIRPAECAATMMTFRTDVPSACGIVEIDERGVLVGYHEKIADPPGNLANGAVFVLESEILVWAREHPAATDFCRDIVPLGLGRFATFENTRYHRDIGTPQALRRARADAAAGI